VKGVFWITAVGPGIREWPDETQKLHDRAGQRGSGQVAGRLALASGHG
jgi:hypothetical protein